MATIRTLFGLTRLSNNQQEPGSIPQRYVEVETTSSIYRSNVQLVGTSPEQLEAGDVSDSAMCIIRNLHASAIIQVGYSSGGFTGLFSIPPGEVFKAPRVVTLSNVYLQSDTVSTEVEVTLHKIAS